MKSFGGGARLLLATLASAMLCGCVSVLPKTKPVQLYRFGLVAGPAPASVRTVGQGGARGVVLSEVRLPRSAGGDGILTTSGDQAAYFGDARWLEPASVLFRQDLEAAFAARAQGVTLLDPGQLTAASGALRVDVTRFETRYPQGALGAAPTVIVRMRATLSRPDGDTVLAREFDVERPADANRVSAVVAAYDAAVDQIADALVAWTDASTPLAAR